MSKIFLCGLILIFTTPLFSQQLDTLSTQPKLIATDYMQRSRHQKTAAWILTMAGTAGLVITVGSENSRKVVGVFVTLFSLGTKEIEQKSYTVPYILSGAALAAGIGFFIAAKQSKNKAAISNTNVYLKMESAPMVQQGNFSRQSYAAVAIRVRLP